MIVILDFHILSEVVTLGLPERGHILREIIEDKFRLSLFHAFARMCCEHRYDFTPSGFSTDHAGWRIFEYQT
jgi:hypothetical protein